MKFSEKMCLMIISKVTKNQSFTLSLEDTFFKKKHRGGQIDPPPLAVLGLSLIQSNLGVPTFPPEHDFENSLCYQ